MFVIDPPIATALPATFPTYDMETAPPFVDDAQFVMVIVDMEIALLLAAPPYENETTPPLPVVRISSAVMLLNDTGLVATLPE